MTKTHFLLALLLIAPLTACGTSEQKDLKSPCAGNAGSPCGPHRAVNDWWLA